jgi:hypothetical protein
MRLSNVFHPVGSILLIAVAILVAIGGESRADPANPNEKLTELQYCKQTANAVRQEVVKELQADGCLQGAYRSQANATVCAEATVFKPILGGPKPKQPLAQIGAEPALNCYTCALDTVNTIKCGLKVSVETTFTLHLGAGYTLVKGNLDVQVKVLASLTWVDDKGPVAKVVELKNATGSDAEKNIVGGVIRPTFTYTDGTVVDVAAGVTWPSGSFEVTVGYKKTCTAEMSIDTWIIPMPIAKKKCEDPMPKPGKPFLTDCKDETTPGTTPGPTPTTSPTTPPK